MPATETFKTKTTTQFQVPQFLTNFCSQNKKKIFFLFQIY